jgi:hypothetical protein
LIKYLVFLYECAAVNVPELQVGLVGSPLALEEQILMDKSSDNKKADKHCFGFRYAHLWLSWPHNLWICLWRI